MQQNQMGEPKLTKDERSQIHTLTEFIKELETLIGQSGPSDLGLQLAVAMARGNISGIRAGARWRDMEGGEGV